jgi:HEAT repeat protein
MKSIRSGIPPKPTDKPREQDEAELKKSAATLQGAAAALRARAAISEIRALFEDDDPDLRLWAARLFCDVDPEAASAATRSIFALTSTQEMLAIRRNARRAPPSRPTLKEMSDNALVVRFEDAAKRQGATQFLDPIDDPEDQETHNRTVIEVTNILAELKARGLLPRLLPFLSSGNLTVRWRAAQGCQRLSEQQAVEALESVIKSGNLSETVPARHILDSWRKGKCLIDGL